jgi:hypothetical protein
MIVLPRIFIVGLVLCTLFVPPMVAALWEDKWSARWEEWW